MHKLKSCGVLVFRKEPELGFLVLRQSYRYDLPKGHVEDGEDELDCALRELVEETALSRDVVRIEPGFRFATTYYPRYRKLGGQTVEKTVVIFLGWLLEDRPVVVTEHASHEWVRYPPPYRLANATIDGALAQAERFFQSMQVAEREGP